MRQNPDNFSIQHMYSKAGKSSSQLLAHLLVKTSKSYSIQKYCDPQSITITPNKPYKKPLKQQPFSQSLSREYLHKLQNQGKPNLSIGIYHPKYSVIQKKSDLGGKFANEHKITLKQGNDSQTSIDFSNIKSRRTKGNVCIRRQLLIQQQNQQQNTSFNTTLNQLLQINTNSVRGSRSAPQKEFGYPQNISKNKYFQTVCDTDYEIGKTRRNYFLSTLDKQTVRNSQMNKSVCLRDQSIYQYDQFSNTHSTIRPITKNIINYFTKVFGKTSNNKQSISSLNRKRVMIQHQIKICQNQIHQPNFELLQ